MWQKRRQLFLDISVVGAFVVGVLMLAIMVYQLFVHPGGSPPTSDWLWPRYLLAITSMAAILATGILYYKAAKLRISSPPPPTPQRTRSTIFICSPGVSFRILSERMKARLDLLIYTSSAVELTSLKVAATIRDGKDITEICEFIDGPSELIGQHRKILDTRITQQDCESVPLGSVVTLSGTAIFREGDGLRTESFDMQTVVLIEEIKPFAAF